MQWDKVKNILIAILLTINLFLLGNLAVRGWQSHRRTSELEANLRTLVSARGMQLDTAFSFPEDITLPELSLDRSRADEEKNRSLPCWGEHAERTEQEDGTVRFESDRGTLEWQADGNVQADYTLTESGADFRIGSARAGAPTVQPVGLSGRAGQLDGGGHGSYADRLGRRTAGAQSAADTGLFCRRRLGVARRTVELRHAVHHRERHQHYLQRSRCFAAVCRRKRRNR